MIEQDNRRLITDCYIADCLRFLTRNAVEMRLYDLLEPDDSQLEIDEEAVDALEDKLLTEFNALIKH